MNQIVVTHCGVMTALGDLDQTWSRLMAGESGLGGNFFSGDLARWPVGAINDLAAGPGGVSRVTELIERGLFGLPSLPPGTGIVVATTKGAADEVMESPEGPWSGQPAAIGTMVASMISGQGPIATVSAACASGTIALIQAAQCLNQSGQPTVFLVTGIDILSRFVESGFASLRALTPDCCRPFDRQRNGLALGEGLGWLVVTIRGEADHLGWPVLASIPSWGVSGDAGHITAPSREASGLLRTLRKTTENGQRKVGGVNAHGTGTPFNDAMEMTAFNTLGWHDTPIHSIKGAIGHCLGGAGVIEAAISIRSLAHGVVPPTVGYRASLPEQQLRISGTVAQELTAPSVLSCNSGFGGINAAVLFENFDEA
ncbi:MAG: beta-ketoacyl synthase [Proteobacteria bacterium]|nr:beta-ketoacyl synthase [Pseudomonadota bacterium]MBU1685866.1 beta-ketoacyl synthase [Pseudomonadota bacterium]